MSPTCVETPSAKKLGVFPPVVAAAMACLAANTKVPLFAPTRLPGIPPDLATRTVGAAVSVTGTGYSVDMGFLDEEAPLEVNGPHTNFSEADMYAFFAAQTQPSVAAATAFIAADGPAVEPVENCPTTTSRVDLGHGVTATFMKTAADATCLASGWLIWMQEDWRFEVSTSDSDESLKLAQDVADYVGAHHLPAEYGLLRVGQGADSGFSHLEWQVGPTVLSIGSFASEAAQDFDMASTMVPYL